MFWLWDILSKLARHLANMLSKNAFRNRVEFLLKKASKTKCAADILQGNMTHVVFKERDLVAVSSFVITTSHCYYLPLPRWYWYSCPWDNCHFVQNSCCNNTKFAPPFLCHGRMRGSIESWVHFILSSSTIKLFQAKDFAGMKSKYKVRLQK